MPKSRLRRKTAFTPPPEKAPVRLESPPWVAALMVGLMLFGLAWLVTFYVVNASDKDVPIISDLHNWNLLIGFAFIAAGFGVATRWK
jgi:Cell division protein CrgA